MNAADKQYLEQVRLHTRIRFGLNSWADQAEHVVSVKMSDDLVFLRIETFDVQSLVREDRFNRRGVRTIVLLKQGSGWHIDMDSTAWDETFVPYVYEKVGRRKTAEELIEQREWEKLCYRPGNGRNPLDSYERTIDPIIRSTDSMERYY